MSIQIEGDIFICWADWKCCFNLSICDYFDSARIASNCIVGFSEGIISNAIDFEIILGINEPTILAAGAFVLWSSVVLTLAWFTFGVINSCIRNLFDYVCLIGVFATANDPIIEIVCAAVDTVFSANNLRGSNAWLSAFVFAEIDCACISVNTVGATSDCSASNVVLGRINVCAKTSASRTYGSECAAFNSYYRTIIFIG